MCDYSLQGLPNRLAVAGERLVTHRFRTGSIGMASPIDVRAATTPKTSSSGGWWKALRLWLIPEMQLNQVPAVCIPPGSRLRMSEVPERLRTWFALREVEEVTFVQLSADAFQYRDAIQFYNGYQMSIQNLREGLPFQVLRLDVDERSPDNISLVCSEEAA